MCYLDEVAGAFSEIEDIKDIKNETDSGRQLGMSVEEFFFLEYEKEQRMEGLYQKLLDGY
jgi:hypothetical protein